MKKAFRYIERLLCLSLAILLLALSLVSCSKGNKFKADGLGYVDKKTKVVYALAPLCYEPIALEEDIYGTDGELEFYKIKGQDPLERVGEADGGVFYSEDLTIPYIDKMNVSRLEICTNAQQIYIRDTVTDSSEISELINAYVSAEGIYYPNYAASRSYKLRFADSSLGIFYCLEFIRYEKDYVYTKNGEEINYGTDFLYNRYEEKFVPAPEALSSRIDAIIGSDE